jgi:hypothetical protein
MKQTYRYNNRNEIGTYNPDGTPKGGQFAKTEATFKRTSNGGNGVWILVAVVFAFAACVTGTIAALEARNTSAQVDAFEAKLSGLALQQKLDEGAIKQNADDTVWLTKSHLRNAEAQNEALDILQSKYILKR